MKICMIIDPIETLDRKKDTSLALMLAAQSYSCSIYFTTIEKLYYANNNCFAQVFLLQLQEGIEIDYKILESQDLPMSDFNLIFIRKDPPITMEYNYALMLLEHAQKRGSMILNAPDALQRSNEKLLILNFNNCCPPTVVSTEKEVIKQFILTHKKVVLKSLNSMGGHNVYFIKRYEKSVDDLIFKITHHSQTPIMAQCYIPEISLGDKRVFLIHGQPFPYALARIPKSGDFRGNLAQGAIGKVQELSENDRWICDQIGNQLKNMGHFFVGLDIIGAYLTEINVTSPTCVREISQGCGIDLSRLIIQKALSLIEPLNASSPIL